MVSRSAQGRHHKINAHLAEEKGDAFGGGVVRSFCGRLFTSVPRPGCRAIRAEQQLLSAATPACRSFGFPADAARPFEQTYAAINAGYIAHEKPDAELQRGVIEKGPFGFAAENWAGRGCMAGPQAEGTA